MNKSIVHPKSNLNSAKLYEHKTYNEEYFARTDSINTPSMYKSRPKHFCSDLDASNELAYYKKTQNSNNHHKIKKEEDKINSKDRSSFQQKIANNTTGWTITPEKKNYPRSDVKKHNISSRVGLDSHFGSKRVSLTQETEQDMPLILSKDVL